MASNKYALLSLPGSATYDTRSNRFNPSDGTHFKAQLAPVIDVHDGGAFLTGEFDTSGYWALDADNRAIVAMRFRGGSILGNSLTDIPAGYRFLAGGGNSVRGYSYRSIGATLDDRLTSGPELCKLVRRTASATNPENWDCAIRRRRNSVA